MFYFEKVTPDHDIIHSRNVVNTIFVKKVCRAWYLGYSIWKYFQTTQTSLNGAFQEDLGTQYNKAIEQSQHIGVFWWAGNYWEAFWMVSVF